MFTGIIENTGVIVRREPAGGQIRFRIRFEKVEKNLRTGESIAVDGACLTVVEYGKDYFDCEVIQETLAATTLDGLRPGGRVNLERSLVWGSRIGGHFVTGHVDGTGKIKQIARKGRNYSLQITVPASIITQISPKGSIAVNGISLTVQEIRGNSFQVGIIPQTLKATTLKHKKAGDRVNLEIDLIQRYLNRSLFQASRKTKISSMTKSLIRQGF